MVVNKIQHMELRFIMRVRQRVKLGMSVIHLPKIVLLAQIIMIRMVPVAVPAVVSVAQVVLVLMQQQ